MEIRYKNLLKNFNIILYKNTKKRHFCISIIGTDEYIKSACQITATLQYI